jgi:hypothetical protein
MKIVNVLVKIFVIDDDEGSGYAASTIMQLQPWLPYHNSAKKHG